MFTLDQVVPWGRSYDEYSRMFALTGADLRSRLLGCADGPASFNAEATRRGISVISCDPLYRLSAEDIRQRIALTFDRVVDETRRNRHDFIWTEMGSVERLAGLRRTAMDAFLEDYEPGRREGRYVAAALPALPFEDRQFDLAVCSHFLFLYSVQFDERFHRASLTELCRVATEVRVFPLLALGGVPSPHVDRVSQALRADGHVVTIETVDYEFQRGGNQMLRLRR
jgi:hypothetical protein